MALPGFRNPGLKVISVVIAVLLWLVVSGEQVVERAIRIPLEYANLPAPLELVGAPPNIVDVRVKGAAGALSRIGAGDLVAVIDLRTARPGERLFHLTPADVRTPFGIEVVQVAPASVSMAFERSATKVVRIVPSVDGDPADGFVVGTVASVPATVEVVGPASALGTLSEAITEPVSVAGATAPVSETVNVGVENPALRVSGPKTARVTVAVTAATAEWTIPRVPVQARHATRPLTVQPVAVTVTARGPRGVVRPLAEQFDASVETDQLGAGQYQLPVHVVPPPGVGVERVEPATVGVTIR